MACPEGLEPPTYSLEGYCSIRLSYGQSLHRYGTDSAGAKRPIIPAGTARSTHENRGNTNAPAARCVPARMVGTGRRGRGDGRAVRSRTGRRNVRTGGAGGGGGGGWGEGGGGAGGGVVQFGHELAAAMCAPGVRVGMSMSAWERSVLLVAFSQGRELSRGKVSSCAGPCRRRFSA